MGCSSSKELDAQLKDDFFGDNQRAASGYQNRANDKATDGQNNTSTSAISRSKRNLGDNKAECTTPGSIPQEREGSSDTFRSASHTEATPNKTKPTASPVGIAPSVVVPTKPQRNIHKVTPQSTPKPLPPALSNKIFVNDPIRPNKFQAPVSSDSFVPNFLDETLSSEEAEEVVDPAAPEKTAVTTVLPPSVVDNYQEPSTMVTPKTKTTKARNAPAAAATVVDAPAAVAPPPPPPPLLSPMDSSSSNGDSEQTSVEVADEKSDLLSGLPQIPRIVDDDDFSVAPSLAVEKRSIVTVHSNDTNTKRKVSKYVENRTANEKTVICNTAFDDIYSRGTQLGFGAFATVFLATHKPSGATYAVKEVDRSSMMWNDKDHLQHEIQNMFKVREGPNIVQLYEVYSTSDPDEEDEDSDIDDDDDYNDRKTNKDKRKKKKKSKKRQRKRKPNICHLVIELMEGGELFDRIIEKRTFTEREARDSIRCVLEALQYMHRRRVVHRDLKPENLLLKSSDKSKLTPVKLADFGFAKSIPSKNGCRSLCGTPGYLAPEILERFPSYDVPCDIWSVGAILFLLLGGYLPFDDENEEKVFDRTRNAAYDFHPRCWGNVSFGAKDLISRCLTIDPRKRFTADDCLKHRWMAKNEVALDAQLGGVVDRLQANKGKRKMRAAVQTVSAVLCRAVFAEGFVPCLAHPILAYCVGFPETILYYLFQYCTCSRKVSHPFLDFHAESICGFDVCSYFHFTTTVDGGQSYAAAQ